MAIPDLKDPTPAPPTNLGHEQNQPCQVYFEPDEIDGTLESYIFSLIHERYEKQKLIDEGRYVKKGPGRNRKFQMTTTKEVKKFVDLFFLERVNKYNNKRTDAWVTMYQRNIKKVTLFLLEKVSVRNKYKSNEVIEFLVAYAETFAVFTMIFHEGLDTPNMLHKFLDFTTIYYPTNKVKHIANLLWEEKSISCEFRDHIHVISDIRDKTSKKDFGFFTQNNACMLAILAYWRDLFEREGKHILKGRMKKIVQKVNMLKN